MNSINMNTNDIRPSSSSFAAAAAAGDHGGSSLQGLQSPSSSFLAPPLLFRPLLGYQSTSAALTSQQRNNQQLVMNALISSNPPGLSRGVSLSQSVVQPPAQSRSFQSQPQLQPSLSLAQLISLAQAEAQARATQARARAQAQVQATQAQATLTQDSTGLQQVPTAELLVALTRTNQGLQAMSVEQQQQSITAAQTQALQDILQAMPAPSSSHAQQVVQEVPQVQNDFALQDIQKLLVKTNQHQQQSLHRLPPTVQLPTTPNNSMPLIQQQPTLLEQITSSESTIQQNSPATQMMTKQCLLLQALQVLVQQENEAATGATGAAASTGVQRSNTNMVTPMAAVSSSSVNQMNMDIRLLAAQNTRSNGIPEGNNNDFITTPAASSGLISATESSSNSTQSLHQDTDISKLSFAGPNQSNEGRWKSRYEELNVFKQRNGHCRVPHGCAEYRKLSWWVMNQRAQYKALQQGKNSWLTEDRIMLLNLLEFEWSPKPNPRRRKSRRRTSSQ